MKRLMLALITVLSACQLLASDDGGGKPSVQSLMTRTEAEEFSEWVMGLEGNWSEAVARDDHGAITGLRLASEQATKPRLRQLATLPKLISLELYASAKHPLTVRTVQQLAEIPKLERLAVHCSGVLDTEVWNALCGLRSLRSVKLNAAYPRQEDLNQVTNLIQLAVSKFTA